MARVTVEDCVDKLPNRFELVMMAAQRARKIGSGSQLTVDRDNDKNPVVSLREIADETISVEELKEDMISSYQRVHAADSDDMDLAELISNEASAMEEEERIQASGAYADADAEDDDMDALQSLAGEIDDEDDE